MYALSGERYTIFNNARLRVLPGMCYDNNTGRFYKFHIMGLVKKFYTTFPELTAPVILKAAAAQELIHKPHDVKEIPIPAYHS
jgi:hypothetical protein